MLLLSWQSQWPATKNSGFSSEALIFFHLCQIGWYNLSMMRNRMMKRLAAWLGCFAILLASLAPSISHALAASNGTSPLWIEICSAQGLKSVETNKTGDPSSTQHGLHFEDCPFCVTHAGSFSLLPPAGFILPVAGSSSILPDLFYQSPHPLFVWAAAQSRAPPFRS
jgi:hypothetical protein